MNVTGKFRGRKVSLQLLPNGELDGDAILVALVLEKAKSKFIVNSTVDFVENPDLKNPEHLSVILRSVLDPGSATGLTPIDTPGDDLET